MGRGGVRPARRQHALRLGRLRRAVDLRAGEGGRRRGRRARSSTSPSRRRCSPPSPRGSPASGSTRGRGSSSRSPSAATYRSAVELNATLHRALRRVGDLPHRPLPRQGGPALACSSPGSPTPSLEPLWNRNVISSVKITMAEAFGVEDRGGVLRLGRRHARRHAEPPAADGRAGRHGAAGQRGLQGAARREGQGARGLPGGRPEALRAGPVRRLPRRARRRRGLRHRDLRGVPTRHRLAPLERRAVLPPRRQGPGPNRHRDDPRVQATAPPAVDQGPSRTWPGTPSGSR